VFGFTTVPTTEQVAITTSTLSGPQPTNAIFSINEITKDTIKLNILDPDNFKIYYVVINAGYQYVLIEKNVVGSLCIISNLSPSTFFSIQYKNFMQPVSASAIIETSAAPESVTNSSRLSDAAIIGIIIGSIFGLILINKIILLLK